MTGDGTVPLPPRVYLTGFMGSGKSTVAPLLAHLLGYSALDLDAEVEAAAGAGVSEIFARDGERRFRELERDALLRTAGRDRVVVAAGGGAIASDEACEFVRSAGGALVWLKADFEILFGRLRSKDGRPMLSGALDDAVLREAMRRLMAEREPFYAKADIVVVPDPSDPARTAASVASALRRRGPGAA